MKHIDVLKKIIDFSRENRKSPTILYIDGNSMEELLGERESHKYTDIKNDTYEYYGLRVVRVAEKEWCEVA